MNSEDIVKPNPRGVDQTVDKLVSLILEFNYAVEFQHRIMAGRALEEIGKTIEEGRDVKGRVGDMLADYMVRSKCTMMYDYMCAASEHLNVYWKTEPNWGAINEQRSAMTGIVSEMRWNSYKRLQAPKAGFAD